MLRNHKVSWKGAARLLLIPMVAALAWGGCERKLSRFEKKSARRALNKLEKVQIKLKDTEKRLMALIKEDKAFMTKAKTVKQAKVQLEKLRVQMKDLKDKGRKMAKLLDKNKGKDASKVRRITRELEGSLNRVKLRLALLIKPVRTLRHAKKNAKRLTRQVKATRATVTSYPPTSVTAAVKKAGKKYPKAKDRITARVKALKGEEIITLADAFDAAQKKDPPEYLAMGQLADRIRAKAGHLSGDRQKLLRHIAELDDHVDLILVDMKEERGRFFHRYKRIRGRKVKTTPWKPVSAAYFRMHEDHLGMALYAKPKGTFHTDANTLASPPGYAYVNNDEYGRWKEKGGEKTWKFKPKYSYMVPLFFGAGLAAVTYVAFRSYRKHRMRRVVWYGLAGGAIWYGTRSARMRRRHKHFYKRRSRMRRMRKARRSKARRSGSRRTGRSGRSSRRSGK
jgi:hypothetical protein